MKKISLQDMLNAAYDAFVVRGLPPAINDVGVCVHLDEQGNRDPLGLCIEDDHPALYFGDHLDETVGEFPELFDDEILAMHLGAGTGDCGLDLFEARLHDDHIVDREFKKTPGELRDAYIRLAKAYNLEMPGAK